jgi:hypothetical protein
MLRIILIVAVLLASAGSSRSTQNVYPPLTRETLVGTWEGLIGIRTHPVVFHVVIAPRNTDSYLSDIYPDSMKGRLFRLESCTVMNGKVTLQFRSTQPGDSAEWWIEGDGFGDRSFACINGRINTGKPGPGPPNFYLERSTWVRDLGQAAIHAAEKIKKRRAGDQ